jgi:hypothetical protein
VWLGVGVMEPVDEWILARVWEFSYHMSIVVGSMPAFNMRILICVVLGIRAWKVVVSALSLHLEALASVLNQWQKAWFISLQSDFAEVSLCLPWIGIESGQYYHCIGKV